MNKAEILSFVQSVSISHTGESGVAINRQWYGCGFRENYHISWVVHSFFFLLFIPCFCPSPWLSWHMIRTQICAKYKPYMYIYIYGMDLGLLDPSLSGSSPHPSAWSHFAIPRPPNYSKRPTKIPQMRYTITSSSYCYCMLRWGSAEWGLS